MAQSLIERVLVDGRSIIADRRRRLRGGEAVDASGVECDPCADEARRFCAVGAFIRAAFDLVGDREAAQRLGWEAAALVAEGANLRRVDEDEPGWGLAKLSYSRGQAAVLRVIDVTLEQRRA
jgi:hypothetical protein